MAKKPLEAIEEHFSKVTRPTQRSDERPQTDRHYSDCHLCRDLRSGRLDGYREFREQQGDLAENLSGTAERDSFA